MAKKNKNIEREKHNVLMAIASFVCQHIFICDFFQASASWLVEN
jgi:hypothetical protein